MVEIIKEWARRIWGSWPFWAGALTAVVVLDVGLGDWGWLAAHATALALCASRWQCSRCYVALERGSR
jgi:hypothetical protein